MKPRDVRAAIMDELALAWLQVPGHAFVPWALAEAQGVNVLSVGRALVELREAGSVLLYRQEGDAMLVSVVLTPQGQAEWINDRAESCLPGVRVQQRLMYQLLQRQEHVSAATLEAFLGLPALRVRQLVLIMRSLGSVQAAVDAAGHFTEIRVRRSAEGIRLVGGA
ncbi:DNA-binding MarR family transcriptional regulator [Deinococcus metalli]|uniref:DNA-binding MarR family transcriptional regulator n=1 Tax=Deinococcus metalli TaxID=1141878 RepID=A0A7W8NTW4_9DEIO|nr:hypothetical protein [Deinococcus metalli]MBB5378652.1 DNA-binding MarR family transcriptional regulator [Deinococcus metalli]GHF61439.1 hypothetical protein GCM10017781_42010 [Deinococcus metalli]